MRSDGRRRLLLSDPHGHKDELVAVLANAGLVDRDGRWAGGDTALFVLGDYFDRGPDGVGVVDLLMRLEPEAAEAGGRLTSLIGNHEALTVGVHRFGPNARNGSPRAETFASSWMHNGGQLSDQERLTDEHLAWLSSLPAVVVDDELLLLHSDTLEYLAWGATVDDINAAVGKALAGHDPDEAWLCWRRLTDRYAFMGADGPALARDLMASLGGTRIVHGHSIIGDLTGAEPATVTEPWWYADGLVLAIDGGLYAGGPLLLVEI